MHIASNKNITYVCIKEPAIMEKYNIEKIWITNDAVWIRTADGREASEKFADYQRLRFATPE